MFYFCPSFLASSLKCAGLVFSFLGEDSVLWGLLEEMDYYLMIMESHVWGWKGLGSWVPPYPVRYMRASARRAQLKKSHMTREK